MNSEISKIFDSYQDLLLKGNRHDCYQLISELKSRKVPFIDIYEQLFKPSLYRIGELWEKNLVSVAVEHISTLITEDLMTLFWPHIISRLPANKQIIISPVENEEHQVGSKMVADVFEHRGWNTHFLGSKTPTTQLITHFKKIKPEAVALSLTVYMNLIKLLAEIEALRRITDVPILIGGQALQKTGKQLAQQFKSVYYFDNLTRLDSFITQQQISTD